MAYCVLFDMDGVIFDTERLYLEVWKGLAVKYGLADIESVNRLGIGSTDEMYKSILKRHYPGKDIDSIYAEGVREYIGIIEKYGPPIKPYAREALEKLRKWGIKTALASSTTTPTIRTELEKTALTSLFDAIIGGDMAAKSKPEPDIFLKACAEIGMKPEEAYVIEDSFNGIRAAHKGGMKPVMVPDMLAPDDEIKSKCVFIAENILEAINYIGDRESV